MSTTTPPPSHPGPSLQTPPAEPTVFVVDDNVALARSLCWLIESVQLRAESFASAQAFLDQFDAARPGCLLLDVRMPGMSGLDLQQRLAARTTTGPQLPILFLSGHGDIRMALRALRAGAFDFIEKPFHEQELLDSIHYALCADAARRGQHRERAVRQALLERLTQREREVLECIVQGLSNKAIAKALGLSAKTVEVHRASLMAKLGAHSVAALVRLALQSEADRSHTGAGWSPG